MSDTTTRERPDPATDPIAYVREAIWPPLPTAYGAWLGDLTHRALNGVDPELELAVPKTVLDTGVPLPPELCYQDDDGITVITLGNALTLFGAEHLLFPDIAASGDPIEIFEPVVALSLANTADAATVADTYDPETVGELAAQLTAEDWNYHRVTAIRVDQQGRVTHGLNTLLAIVQANRPAPALAYYENDQPEGAPYTWRGPTGWTDGAPHEH
jgi:hypothetical protein